MWDDEIHGRSRINSPTMDDVALFLETYNGKNVTTNICLFLASKHDLQMELHITSRSASILERAKNENPPEDVSSICLTGLETGHVSSVLHPCL
jgi:hypothetical protein